MNESVRAGFSCWWCCAWGHSVARVLDPWPPRHVYGDGVLCLWHAGDVGQRSREEISSVSSSRVRRSNTSRQINTHFSQNQWLRDATWGSVRRRRLGKFPLCLFLASWLLVLFFCSPPLKSLGSVWSLLLIKTVFIKSKIQKKLPYCEIFLQFLISVSYFNIL